jgi:hypothetical protein
MKEIQSMLKILSDGLKMIAQGMEAVSEKVDEIAKSQAAEEPKAAAKKSSPAAAKKRPARKAAFKAPKKKAAKAPTAAETVYNVISRSKKGVDTATLMKKTGYDRKKIANMVYRLGKQEKIKTVEKGIYVKA